jgi:GMP synthase (glutamine-hydrolysing)
MAGPRPLRLGLLVCDHVSPEFVDVAGDYPDMFDRLFTGHAVDVVHYDLPAGRFPERVDECEAWITTGSRRSVYEPEGWIGSLGALVRSIADARIPFVGVCFGHQMMAQALGGTVVRSERGWGVGVKEVALERTAPWMGAADSYRIINSHADQIDVLPPGASVLGGNDHCPVSLMTIGDHMLGIQGHPEFGPEYARVLLEARRGRLIPADVADAALLTLGDPPDTKRLVDWIVAFANGGGAA